MPKAALWKNPRKTMCPDKILLLAGSFSVDKMDAKDTPEEQRRQQIPLLEHCLFEPEPSSSRMLLRFLTSLKDVNLRDGLLGCWQLLTVFQQGHARS